MLNRRTFVSLAALGARRISAAGGRTAVSIRGDGFLINGRPTYAGREYKGSKIEGLLMNSRVVQGIFDDSNPETRERWRYPDTGKWDAQRNTREFIAAMPTWRAHGLLAFTINLQGGSPEGYSKGQPWLNSAIDPDGGLRADYMGRLERILNKADELGMVAIVGLFYFGQDQHVRDEAAVRRAVSNSVHWLLERDYRNAIIEVANETNSSAFDHAILKPPRIHELIQLVKSVTVKGNRLLAGTSYGGGRIPESNVVGASDFVLLHGNGVKDPARITEMIAQTKKVPGYRTMPILFNEDDHFDFDKPDNNMLAAVRSYVSWGYFDPGKSDYADGYQCPPVNWGLNTERKKAFFALLKQVTGS
jgi:hypothetical protein